MKEHFYNATGSANPSTNMFLVPDSEMIRMQAVNNCYKPGVLMKDLGYLRVGNVAEVNSVTGLFNFRQSGSVQKILMTVNDSGDNDTQLFYNNSGTWTEITAAETAWANKADINVEMEGFVGYCYFVGYGATDGFLPVGSLTGTTFSTSTNVTDMPQGKFIKRYRDRLYVANLYDGGNLPYRIGWSDIPSVAAGTLGWTGYQADTNLQDVDYSEEITGMGTNWDRLVVFTENSAYMYDGQSFKKAWDIGCSNHRTIKTYGQYMIWANRDGVFVSTGGYPQKISDKVAGFIRNATSPLSFFGECVDEEYNLYVGDVTVDGIAYTNCEITFNFARNVWRWREYADTMTIYAEYNDSGIMRKYMGCSTGEVWQKSKYSDSSPSYSDGKVTTTDGDPITAIFEYPPFHAGDPSVTKRISDFVAYAKRAQGVQLSYRVIDKNNRSLTPYKPIGQLNKFLNTIDAFSTEGTLIQIQGTETSTNPYFEFYGFSADILPVGAPLK